MAIGLAQAGANIILLQVRHSANHPNASSVMSPKQGQRTKLNN